MTDIADIGLVLTQARRTAAVSHRAAAVLHGVAQDWSLAEASWATPLKCRRQGVVMHRMPDLLPSWIVERYGVPVTSPARTLVDLGMVTSSYVVECALESMLTDGLVTAWDLQAALEAHSCRGRRGVGVLRSAVRLVLGSTAGMLRGSVDTYG